MSDRVSELQQAEDSRGVLLRAVACLREGTEILRTGGGTSLTASQCSALLDTLDSAMHLHNVASQTAWEAWEEWRDDPGAEREGAWARDLFTAIDDPAGLAAIRSVDESRASGTDAA